MTLAADRISKGLCPQCGKEAAPYRLCHDCRQKRRLTHSLRRGTKFGVVEKIGIGHATMWRKGPKINDDEACKQYKKWGTLINLPETDGRAKPRVQGIRINVEATLIEVVRAMGRPCTIEEITEAWGRLRAKRADPLAGDIARIIAANDKRQRRAAKRAALVGNDRFTPETKKMNPELKAKWVEALRSGKFKQGQSRLHDNNADTYCCLGVLCVVASAEWVETDTYEEFILDGNVIASSDEEMLTSVYCQEIGIGDQTPLFHRNDGYTPLADSTDQPVRPHSFAEIADYIENNL